jgi:hypothetical protein
MKMRITTEMGSYDMGDIPFKDISLVEIALQKELEILDEDGDTLVCMWKQLRIEKGECHVEFWCQQPEDY